MKANLVVHPDKVKQKGGTLEQVQAVQGGGMMACSALLLGLETACGMALGLLSKSVRRHAPPACPPLPQVTTADMVFDVLKIAWGKFEASK